MAPSPTPVSAVPSEGGTSNPAPSPVSAAGGGGGSAVGGGTGSAVGGGGRGLLLDAWLGRASAVEVVCGGLDRDADPRAKAAQRLALPADRRSSLESSISLACAAPVTHGSGTSMDHTWRKSATKMRCRTQHDIELPSSWKGKEGRLGGHLGAAEQSPCALEVSAAVASLPLDPIQYPARLAWSRHGHSLRGLAPSGPAYAVPICCATIHSPRGGSAASALRLACVTLVTAVVHEALGRLVGLSVCVVGDMICVIVRHLSAGSGGGKTKDLSRRSTLIPTMYTRTLCCGIPWQRVSVRSKAT